MPVASEYECSIRPPKKKEKKKKSCFKGGQTFQVGSVEDFKGGQTFQVGSISQDFFFFFDIFFPSVGKNDF